MERRFLRQYENFDTVVPDISEFPILEDKNQQSDEVIAEQHENTEKQVKSFDISNMKTDDLILLGLIGVLFLDKENNMNVIIILALLFLSDYITI